MAQNKRKQRKAEYILNRVEMLNAFKAHRDVIEKISLEGVSNEEENRIAKIACSIIASEYHYDDSVMDDKTSSDGDFPVLPFGLGDE